MTKMIVFSSTAFKDKAKTEIREIFGKCKFEDLFEGNFIFDNENSKAENLKKLKEKDPIFVHNALPIDIYIDSLENYKDIAERIIKDNLLKKDKPFSIETITYSTDIPSRDIEVQVGSSLEKEGYIADRKNLYQLVGILVDGEKIYVGSADTSSLLYPYLNLAKRFSRESIKESRLNRAQFKLIEALERFNINLDGHGKYALDLGASPGGWTKVLFSKGYEVIAVDKGDLDESLNNKNGIYHIKKTITKENMNDIKKSLGNIVSNKKLDIITNDMNLSPNESYDLMNDFSGYLCDNGKAIMTLKSVKRNIMDLLKETKEKLRDNYDIIKIKHLEQNRREVTLYLNKR